MGTALTEAAYGWKVMGSLPLPPCGRLIRARFRLRGRLPFFFAAEAAGIWHIPEGLGEGLPKTGKSKIQNHLSRRMRV